MKTPPWYKIKISQNEMVDPFLGPIGNQNQDVQSNNIGGFKNELETLVSNVERLLLEGRTIVPQVQMEMEQAVQLLNAALNKCVDSMANKPNGGSL